MAEKDSYEFANNDASQKAAIFAPALPTGKPVSGQQQATSGTSGASAGKPSADGYYQNVTQKGKLILPTAIWILIVVGGLCFLSLLSSLNKTINTLDELIEIEQASAKLNDKQQRDIEHHLQHHHRHKAGRTGKPLVPEERQQQQQRQHQQQVFETFRQPSWMEPPKSLSSMFSLPDWTSLEPMRPAKVRSPFMDMLRPNNDNMASGTIVVASLDDGDNNMMPFGSPMMDSKNPIDSMIKGIVGSLMGEERERPSKKEPKDRQQDEALGGNIHLTANIDKLNLNLGPQVDKSEQEKNDIGLEQIMSKMMNKMTDEQPMVSEPVLIPIGPSPSLFTDRPQQQQQQHRRRPHKHNHHWLNPNMRQPFVESSRPDNDNLGTNLFPIRPPYEVLKKPIQDPTDQSFFITLGPETSAKPTVMISDSQQQQQTEEQILESMLNAMGRGRVEEKPKIGEDVLILTAGNPTPTSARPQVVELEPTNWFLPGNKSQNNERNPMLQMIDSMLSSPPTLAPTMQPLVKLDSLFSSPSSQADQIGLSNESTTTSTTREPAIIVSTTESESPENMDSNSANNDMEQLMDLMGSFFSLPSFSGNQEPMKAEAQSKGPQDSVKTTARPTTTTDATTTTTTTTTTKTIVVEVPTSSEKPVVTMSESKRNSDDLTEATASKVAGKPTITVKTTTTPTTEQPTTQPPVTIMSTRIDSTTTTALPTTTTTTTTNTTTTTTTNKPEVHSEPPKQLSELTTEANNTKTTAKPKSFLQKADDFLERNIMNLRRWLV